MSMKMHKRNVLSRNKLLVIAAVLAAHVGVCATPSFSKAKPVWPEGREKEWNCQVGFTAEFDGRDALVASNAVLRYTGATMCRVFLNGEFLGYGPARAARNCSSVMPSSTAQKAHGTACPALAPSGKAFAPVTSGNAATAFLSAPSLSW